MRRVLGLLTSAPKRRLLDVAHLILDLQQEGRRVVFVTANLPASVWMGQLEAVDVDPESVTFVDAISGQDCAHTVRENVQRLPGPSLLELMALRMRKIVQFWEHEAPDGAPPAIILGSLDALALYNDRGMLEQFLHRLQKQWAHRPNPVWMVLDARAGSEAWLGRLARQYAQEVLPVTRPDPQGPPGRSVPTSPGVPESPPRSPLPRPTRPAPGSRAP